MTAVPTPSPTPFVTPQPSPVLVQVVEQHTDFHEALWVILGTAAPVIVLGQFVAMSRLLAAYTTAESGTRIERLMQWTVLACIAPISVSIAIFWLALVSVQAQANKLPPYAAGVALTLSMFFTIGIVQLDGVLPGLVHKSRGHVRPE